MNENENNELKADEATETTEAAEEITEAQPSLEDQLVEMKGNWMRAVADAENLRRRHTKEREEALKFGATNFARDIIGVFDNLERAVQAAETTEERSDDLQNLLTGINMTMQEIDSSFKKNGIEKIDAVGKAFDPNLHQAMFETESKEHDAGTVLQVIQSGYTIHGRLLRPAMVGIAKAAKEDAADQTAEAS